MSRVTTYLNFDGNAAEALAFYGDVFGTSVQGDILRMGDAPAPPGAPQIADDERDLVMHLRLPILAGHLLMTTDIVPSMGHQLRVGNNTTINLEPDTREETDRLYAALSDGGSESSGMLEMPWGYWGVTLDRFSIRWMLNFYAPTP